MPEIAGLFISGQPPPLPETSTTQSRRSAMKAGIGHGSIGAFQSLSRTLFSRKTSMTWQGKPWICSSCYHQQSEYSASKTKAFSTRPVPKRQYNLHLSRPSSCNLSTSSQNDASNPPSSDTPPPTSPIPPSPPLPSHAENARSPTSKRLSHLMDNLQSSLFVASRRLNDLTGYTGIESLKSSIAAQESLLSSTRARLQAARAAYTAAIQTRSASQREVNELLQRKHAWSALDLERFTALYRSDHANEQAEAKAQAELGRVEREAEESGERLSQSILTRYHEEQIWSDKIRRMSTWGTWGLMGVNVLLFLVFQIGVEPWRRRRLVKGFEEKVVEALERGEEKGGTLTVSNGAGFKPTVEKEEDVQFRGEEDATPSARVEMEIDKEVDREVVAAQASMLSSIYGTSLAALKDLFSDRKITLRKVDVTLMVAEGAAAGMVVVGVIASLLRSR